MTAACRQTGTGSWRRKGADGAQQPARASRELVRNEYTAMSRGSGGPRGRPRTGARARFRAASHAGGGGGRPEPEGLRHQRRPQRLPGRARQGPTAHRRLEAVRYPGHRRGRRNADPRLCAPAEPGLHGSDGGSGPARWGLGRLAGRRVEKELKHLGVPVHGGDLHRSLADSDSFAS